MEVKYRIQNYKERILSLQHILTTTTRKDNDIREEIKEEILDLENEINKLL